MRRKQKIKKESDSNKAQSEVKEILRLYIYKLFENPS